MKTKIITVACKCGFTLFKYKKHGSGSLIKCFRDNILEANIDISNNELLSKTYCPNCQKQVGYWNRIKGRIALKINNGAIERIRIG